MTDSLLRIIATSMRIPWRALRACAGSPAGQQPRERLVPYVILSVLEGKQPRLTAGGLLADWTHVDDMVNGLLAAGRAQNVNGQTID